VHIRLHSHRVGIVQTTMHHNSNTQRSQWMYRMSSLKQQQNKALFWNESWH